jgi:hypothetical protein
MCVRSFSYDLFSTKQDSFILLKCNRCEVILARVIIFLILCRRIWCVEHHEWWARRLWYACNFPESWGEPRYMSQEKVQYIRLLFISLIFLSVCYCYFYFYTLFCDITAFVSLNWLFSWSYIDVPFINSVLLRSVNLHSHATFSSASTLVHTAMCIL